MIKKVIEGHKELTMDPPVSPAFSTCNSVLTYPCD